MSQRRGRPAEAQFSFLCTTAGITCNPSEQDDYGWDFLVEIPMPAAEGSPADKWPPPRQAFVQVKSTRQARPGIRMKVSNALQLAKNPAPCFMVLFHDLKAGQRIYARLFGEKDMERALKRARQLSAAGKAPHKASTSFAFSEQDEHTADLLDCIAKRVRGLRPGYGEDKTRLADRIGYGKSGYRATITLSGSRALDDLADLQLGLKDELRVSGISVFDMRFGIQAPAPAMDDRAGGILRLQPENDIRCDVALQTADHAMSFPSRARISTLKGPSPKDVSISFTNELFILVVAGDRVRFTFREEASNKLPLRELEHLATMLAWRERDVQIKVTGDVPTIALRMRVSGENRTFLDKGVADTIAMLRNQASRTTGADIRLSLDDILAAYHALKVYRDVLSGAQMSIGTRLDDPSFDPAKLRNLLGLIDVEVGEFTFATLFDAAIQTHVNEPGTLQIEPGRRNPRDSVIGRGRKAIRSRAQAIHDRFSAAYGNDWLALGSLNALTDPQHESA